MAWITVLIFHLLIKLVECCGLWRFSSSLEVASDWSTLEIAFVLLALVGTFAIAISAILLIPRLIITWTMSLLFEFFLGGESFEAHRFVHEGYRMALEIYGDTLVTILWEGKLAGFVAMVLWLLAMHNV